MSFIGSVLHAGGGAIGGLASGFGFGSIAGPLISAGASLLGGYQSNQWSAASTKKQMKFQEYMSNTAHQREVNDLIKAGLNPILSAKYGGASTPAGASYTGQDIGTPAASAYREKQLANSQVKLQEANTSKAWQETTTQKVMQGVLQSQKQNYEANSAKASMEMLESMHRSDQIVEQLATQRELTKAQIYENVKRLWDAGFYKTPLGKEMLRMEKFRQAGGTIGIGGYTLGSTARELKNIYDNWHPDLNMSTNRTHNTRRRGGSRK